MHKRGKTLINTCILFCKFSIIEHLDISYLETFRCLTGKFTATLVYPVLINFIKFINTGYTKFINFSYTIGICLSSR